MIRNHWSCSKFADFIRGTPKILAGTSKDWRQWRKDAKDKHPVRFWLAEEFLEKIQHFLHLPYDKFYDVTCYIKNRWIHRSNSLTAHPMDIKPGNWQDVGNRFLPCMFNELQDFVEIELAWMNAICDEESSKKYKIPKWKLFNWRWRSPESGLEYLKWAMSLIKNEEYGLTNSDPEYGKPTQQAINAREIHELYIWWTKIYRNREDPSVISGWHDFCEEKRKSTIDILDFDNESPISRSRSRKILDHLQKIEQEYENEDTEMLIRLIKVRNSLWT